MQTYKATNGQTSYLKNFATLQDAENYYIPLLDSEFTVLLAEPFEQIPQRVITLEDRMRMGIEIYKAYLQDNDELAKLSGQPMPASMAEAIAVSMAGLKLLLESGSLVQSKEILLAKTPDAILTQARLDKYVAMIDNFLTI